jgi:hypothetical protein
MRSALRAIVFVILGLALPGAAGAVVTFSAVLAGDTAVPPTNSQAVGSATFVLEDTNEFTYLVDLRGTLSSVETGCTINGPCARDETAPVLYTLPSGAHKEGSVGVLTEVEIVQVMDGEWYCNLLTQNFPGGEIRCQIENTTAAKQKTWAAVKALYRSR